MFNINGWKSNPNISFDDFFNSMNEGFAIHEIICDESGKPIDYRFKAVNQAFLCITNTSKEQILNKTVTEVFPKIERKWIELYGDIALNGSRKQFEAYSPFLNKYFKVSVFSPEIGIFITFFYDITSLKKSIEIQKQHKVLFDNAQDMILYVNLDGKIINANKSALKKYGYSLKEITELRIQDLRHPKTMSTFNDEMNASDTEGITFESIHLKKDTSSFPVEVSVKSVINEKHETRLHIIRDISERKKAEKEMFYLANYDALTEIPNRANLMNHLNDTIEQAKRGEFKFALMLFDIDKFKLINDEYGHSIGDIVLKETAKKVEKTIRRSDFIARLGGDEFIVIQSFLKETKDASTLAYKILEQFKTPINADSNELLIRLSIGIAIFPDDAENKDELISFADKAMYYAKQSDTCKYKLYSSL